MSQAGVGSESERALLLALPGGPPGPARRPPPPALARVLVAVALFVTAVAMTVPARPALVLDAVGGGAREAAAVMGVADAMAAAVEIVASPVLGVCSDVVGRRPLLLLSQVGEVAGLLIIAQFHTHVASYFVANLLMGLTGAFFMTVSAILGDVSVSLDDPGAGAANFGLLGATVGGCFLVGPALGGLIEDRLYQTASFHAAAVGILCSMVYVYVFVPETRVLHSDAADGDRGDLFAAVLSVNLNPLPKIRGVFSSPALQWLAAGIAVSSFAQGGLNSILFLYLNLRLGWRAAETGYFLSAVGLSLLIAQGFLVRVAVACLGESRTIVLGYCFAVTHYVVYAYARSPWIAYFGLAVGCLSFIAEPAMKSLLCRQVAPSEQGSLQGALAGLTTLLRPLSPLFATTIFAFSTAAGAPGLVFIAISILSATSLGIVFAGLRKPGLK